MRNFLATALCSMFLTTGVAHAGTITNLVTNGDFSTTTMASGTNKQQINDSSLVTGWSVSSSNKLIFIGKAGSATSGSGGANGIAVYSPFPDHDTAGGTGGNFIESDGDPNYATTLYQSLSNLVIGQQYVVSFDFAGSEQNGYTSPSGYTTEWWNVSLSSNVLTSAPTDYLTAQNGVQKSALLTTPNGKYSDWQTATMTFTATATTEVLSFLAGGTPTGTPPVAFLDNVVVQVPEPATLSLMAVGLVGLVGVSRRARRATAKA